MIPFVPDLPVIDCILVVYPSGERVWEPMADYYRNPARDSYVLQESRRGERVDVYA